MIYLSYKHICDVISLVVTSCVGHNIFVKQLFQEFPEKTRPIGFKHPPFMCPDMSPSSSVPTSGRLV